MSRFPPIPPPQLNAEQKELHDKLESGAKRVFQDKGFKFQRSDGALVGPFAPMMYTPPAIANSFFELVTSLGKVPDLSAAARETAILAVGALYKSKYEVYAHIGVAETTGALSRRQIDRLAAGQPPAFEGEDAGNKDEIQTAYDVTAALVTEPGPLRGEVWERAVKVFGKMGAAVLVHYVGAYIYTSVILNGFDVPVPTEDE